VITPRGFTSLPTQEVEYGFSGFIPTNNQTNTRVASSKIKKERKKERA